MLEENPKSISALVKEFRRSRNLDQVEVAVAIDVDRGTISKWENGESVPSNRHREALAKFLQKDLSYIDACIFVSKRSKEQRKWDAYCGYYELYQWTFLGDHKIIKTVVNVELSSRASPIFFEHILIAGERLLVKGKVSLLRPNIFFTGMGKYGYDECETMIFRVAPTRTDWLFGLSTGISRNEFYIPSSSRAVLKYVGTEISVISPGHGSIEEFQLPERIKKFLTTQGGMPAILAAWQER